MSAVVLALGAAVGWGSSDFLGGLKSRAAPLFAVLLISQGTALVTLTVLTVLRGAGPPDRASIALAAAAGLSEAVMKLTGNIARVWFLALYLPDPWQWPTIVGMITIGLANYGAALGLYLTARSARSETFGAAVRA